MKIFRLVAIITSFFLLNVGSAWAQDETPSHGDIRFASRPAPAPTDSPTKGRLEVYNSNADNGNGEWQWVCDDGFGKSEAQVACKQLGLTYNANGVEVFTPSGWTSTTDLSTPGFLDDLDCETSDNKLIDCTHSGEGVTDCSISESVGVVCAESSTDPHGTLRIVGDTASRGRLEIFLDAQWGTVCDDEFDDKDADVACRQMGYSSGTDDTASIYVHWDPAGSNIPVHLDDLLCAGTESKLIDCPLRCDNDNPQNNKSHANLAACPGGLDDPNCFHIEDAGVQCTN